MDTDVLIVGAGPTGLMLANQLMRRGVRPLIIDRHAGPARETRALGVQARTLEIYAQLGIIDQALKQGTRATGANMWASGKLRAHVPVGDIGQDISPYPYLLILGQDENERLLGENLRRLGLEINWNTELVALAQQASDVTATLKQPDGSTREVEAKWVAGCDGARSAVRSLNHIPFVGAPYEHVFFVADTTLTGPMVPGELNVYLWRDGFHLFFPMHGTDHWRLVGILPDELRNKENLTFDAVAPAIRREAGSLDFKECRWFSTYRIHHRKAERFRHGRCFLLGDAAHIHSPVGAQGMNTGLQDAYNLAWKLALVVSGKATESLLDSYPTEREPVAERLLSTTDRLFMLIVSDNWLAGLFRTKIMARIAALAMTIERVRLLAFRTISQTGVHYRPGSLSEKTAGWPEKAPQPGDRFPWLRVAFSTGGAVEDLFQKLDDTRFNLLVIGQSANGLSNQGNVLIHQIPNGGANTAELAHQRIPTPSFFLLRPDGHIGLAGTQFDGTAVTRYLAKRVGIK